MLKFRTFEFWTIFEQKQQSPVNFYLCLKKTRAEEYHNYRKIIAFEKLRFQDVFLCTLKRAPKAALFLNSTCLKSVFEKLCFRDGLVWTVGLTVEIKLRFRDGLVWTVGLTVEIKLCFRDGLVWTVGLTVEIKLRFRDGLVWTVGLTVEMKLRFRDGLVWTVGLTVEIKLRFRDALVWTVGLTVENEPRFRFLQRCVDETFTCTTQCFN